jgi:hypothetical protein
MSKVYVKFPKTGLGNLMLVWARACVFAHLNELPLITSPWWAFRWGAWIRNEKRKRLYWGYFKENTYFDRWIIQLNRINHTEVYEPEIKKVENSSKRNLFIFNQVIVDNDLFLPIREHSAFIMQELNEILNPTLKKELERFEVPVISVHIRRGDFKMGNPITPESFFIESIDKIRSAAKGNLPVTIFTDANEDEIKNVLAIPNTKLSVVKADILDILLMSKSKFIILSQSSTFSYWAAYLSDAIIIIPSEDWQKKIKEAPIHSNYKEIRGIPDEKVLKEIISLNQLNGQKIQATILKSS